MQHCVLPMMAGIIGAGVGTLGLVAAIKHGRKMALAIMELDNARANYDRARIRYQMMSARNPNGPSSS